MRRISLLFASAFVLPVVLPLSPARAEEPEDLVVEDGRTVSIQYTLSFDDDTESISNEGGEPLVYTHGEAQILPALEDELEGMEVDDTAKVTLEPDDAYGELDPERRVEVELERIPEEAREAGTPLVVQDEQGNQQPVVVHEVKEETVVLDLNHPLAGKTLQYDVKILKIE